MADLKLAVRLSLEGQAQFKAGLRGAAGAVGGLGGRGRGPLGTRGAGALGGRRGADPGRDLDRLGARVGNTGLALERSARRTGTALLSVVGPALEYDKAITTAIAVTDAVADSQNELKLRALSKDFTDLGFSSRVVAESIGFMGMAGLSTEQIVGSMGISLKLASASGVDAARAIDLGTDVMTSFGIKTTTAAEATAAMTRVSDVLVRTMTETNTNLPLLSRAMFEIGPIAASTGTQIEGAAGAFGILASAGIKGSKSGNALKNVFLRLANPTKSVRKGFKTLGVDLGEFNARLESDDLAGAFEGLAAAGEKLGKTKFRKGIAQAFGTRAAAGATELTRAAGTGELRAAIEDRRAAAGTTERISARKQASDSAAAARARARLEEVAVTIGQKVLPQLLPVAEGFLEVAEGLAKFAEANPGLVKGLTKTIITMAATAAVTGPVLTTFGGLIRGASLLQTGLTGGAGGGVAGAINKLSVTSFKAASPIGKLGVALGSAGLVAAAAAGGIAVGTLIDQLFGISDQAAELLSGISRTRDEAGKLLAKERGTFFQNAAEQALVKEAEDKATAASQTKRGALVEGVAAIDIFGLGGDLATEERREADRTRAITQRFAKEREAQQLAGLAGQATRISAEQSSIAALKESIPGVRRGKTRRRLQEEVAEREARVGRRRTQLEALAQQTPGFRAAGGVQQALQERGLNITLDVKNQTIEADGREIPAGGGVTIPGMP